MINREIYIGSINEQTIALVKENGKNVEMILPAPDTHNNTIGDLYTGRIEQIISNIDAVFVDIGAGKNAFLPRDEIPVGVAAVRTGDLITVQVVKGAVGNKGAKLTMNLAIPGNLLVLLPYTKTVLISKHIEDKEKRAQLSELVNKQAEESRGFIIRTAAENAETNRIIDEISGLSILWEEISAKASKAEQPGLLWSFSDVAERIWRDLYLPGCTRILQGELAENEIKQALSKIEERKLWLKSGAYLVIDRCEALTAIDVNSGKFTRRSSRDETILMINQEAAQEAARQIRLRDIGGIIIIDFIDMAIPEYRDMVFHSLELAFKSDRAKYHLHGFTSAGLFEITRRSLQGNPIQMRAGK